jgi:hypothetical protein
MPRLSTRHPLSEQAYFLYVLRPEAIRISLYEPRSIHFSKVAKTCLLKIVRSLGIVTAVVLDVTCAGLQSIMVALAGRGVSAIEHIMAVPAVVIEVRVIPKWPSPPRIIEAPVNWPIWPDDYNPTSLSLDRTG